ncbi:MAG: GGDEF domain-containing protein [Myxococcota bacterium]|nr:GGDEF domain-containing protein [Myxococcota bacterium]
MAVHRSGLGRLRNNFSAVLDEQVAALAWLAREAQSDPALLEPLAADLERLEETAAALDLVELSHAAARARAATQEGGLQDEMQSLLSVCRSLDGRRPVFRPLLVLEPDSKSAMRLRVRARSCAVQVDFVEDVQALLESAQGQEPFAAVVPYESLAEVAAGLRAIDRLATLPIYAFSEQEQGLQKRAEAARIGADGWVRVPLEIPAMLWRIRQHIRSGDLHSPSMVVCGPRSAARISALAPELKVNVVATGDSGKLLDLLDQVGPDLVVLDDTDAAPLLPALRGHDRWHQLSMAVYGKAPLPQVPQADLLLSELSDAVLVQQIQGRIKRRQRAAAASLFDPDTAVMSRNAFLSSADREVGLSLRSGEPTAAALLELHGWERLVEQRGNGGADQVLRSLAHSLQSAIRETDVIGRVGPWTLGILLVGCDARQAMQRLGGIQEGLIPEGADVELEDLRFTGGVADTLGGPALLQRAESALHRARLLGPGTIGQ